MPEFYLQKFQNKKVAGGISVVIRGRSMCLVAFGFKRFSEAN